MDEKIRLKSLSKLLKMFPQAYFVKNGEIELILHKGRNIYLLKSLQYVGKETPYTDYYPFMIEGGPTYKEWLKERYDE